MSYQRRSVSGGRLYHGAELQWQPTLTVHDPNPPIVLETPAAPPEPPSGVPLRTMMGMGL